MATATASVNNTTGTFMFHPRTAVFEHPITYDLSSLNNSTLTINKKSENSDLSQYYISKTSYIDLIFLVSLLIVLYYE